MFGHCLKTDFWALQGLWWSAASVDLAPKKKITLTEKKKKKKKEPKPTKSLG